MLPFGVGGGDRCLNCTMGENEDVRRRIGFVISLLEKPQLLSRTIDLQPQITYQRPFSLHFSKKSSKHGPYPLNPKPPTWITCAFPGALLFERGAMQAPRSSGIQDLGFTD